MAFVHVQSYLHIMGRNATYEETTNIVKKYGFSVEEYTLIATWMNEDPLLRDLVHALVKETDIR